MPVLFFYAYKNPIPEPICHSLYNTTKQKGEITECYSELPTGCHEDKIPTCISPLGQNRENMRIANIMWDVQLEDGTEAEEPGKEMTIPDMPIDEVADYLSDKTDLLVKNFNVLDNGKGERNLQNDCNRYTM